MLNRQPHRRFDPLRQRWVLVSPDRTSRPWQGQVETPPVEILPAFDPACHLCPGNERVRGLMNPPYRSTFAFDNDFAALLPALSVVEGPALSVVEGPSASPLERQDDELIVARTERGVCRVVSFSPRHDLTLARMTTPAIRAIVDTWIDECVRLAAVPWIQYVQVFENRGPMMGASNPHPHGQIWATETVPNEPARERESLAEHRERHGACLLCDYAAREVTLDERVVCRNDMFLAVVPFWAEWPFETLLMSVRHVGAMHDLDESEREALADILRRLTIRYDNLFESSFPYSMGFHQPPLRDDRPELWHFHAHFYPPLLRSTSIRKFMVGFELLGSPQRDLTAEDAAARLREASEVHYTAAVSEGAAR